MRSGKITVLNEKTFFIENLHYDGKGPDAHFWAGKGKPSPKGTLVPDEKKSRASLSRYAGQNVTIELPGNLTIKDIDYLGMWCIAFTQDFGHVLMTDVEDDVLVSCCTI